MFANHYLQHGEFLTREEKAERAHSFKHGKVQGVQLKVTFEAVPDGCWVSAQVFRVVPALASRFTRTTNCGDPRCSL